MSKKRLTLEQVNAMCKVAGAKITGFSKLSTTVGLLDKSNKTGTNLPSVKPSKYHNKKVNFNGFIFDSKKELSRWQYLVMIERQGFIKNLERQVKYDIVINGIKVCRYIADFRYIMYGLICVEDVKSAITKKLPIYRLKNKLLLACNGIKILET
jgi:hypothetical protein